MLMEMLRVWATFCCAAVLVSGSDTPREKIAAATQILERAREQVLQQLRQSANYTCTEVMKRKYFFSDTKQDAGCSSREERVSKHLYMEDRLRLDVAVADQQEMFSWHGGREFSTSGIESIVRSGSVSSGSFFGYLRNIFGERGVIVRSTGHISGSSGERTMFDYAVPLTSSGQNLEVAGKKMLVPFHGSFTVDDRTNQLTDLAVIIDKAPPQSKICSAAIEIHYQVVNISQQPSMIPSIDVMDLELADHVYSSSRTEFTDCHAFRGESVIQYSDVDEGRSGSAQRGPEQLLPPGVKLRGALTSIISDADSYMGDTVKAVLRSPVEVRGGAIRLNKGAVLQGVITKLESYFVPAPHYRLSIRLDSVTDGSHAYRLNGMLQTPGWSVQTLEQLYHASYRSQLTNEREDGDLVFLGRSFHTPANLNTTWITIRSPGE